MVATASAETPATQLVITVDGDTVKIECPNVSPCPERIRLTTIDAPETFEPDCEDEAILGNLATERMFELLKGQPVTIARSGKRDRWGRTLADIAVPAGDVGQILMREGLALPWSPGARAKAARIATWCNGGQ